MKRIQTKITLTYVLLTLLAVSAFTVIASLATRSTISSQKVNELSARIDTIAPLLFPETGDSLADAYRNVQKLSKAMNVRITLLDAGGLVLMDSDIPLHLTPGVPHHGDRPEIQQARNGGLGTATRHSETIDQDLLYVAKRHEIPGTSGVLSRVRIIRLSAHLGDIQAIAKEERNAILMAGALVLVLVLGVSIFLSRRIADPIVEIGNAVQSIRSGNLDTRIAIRSNDEVGRVAQAVNEMVETLKADIVKLKKLERVRSEFLGNVSHELRTPIFSLQGFLETLLEGAIDDPVVNREFVQKAYNHSARLNTLLNELITISHIESGEMKMSFRYFNVNELFDILIAEFSPTAEQYKIQLRIGKSVPPALEILGDKERIRVVFENLIENAIKYNRPGGEVVLSSELQGDKVLLSVADTGVGISPEHQPRIFERFYRVDRNRSREVGGTGLGLAIVKHIVEAHGSTIQLESTPGKGSEFSFLLKR